MTTDIHKMRRIVSVTCAHCGLIVRRLKTAKYCSDKCRYDAANERRKLNDTLKDITRSMAPTSGYHKLGSAAQSAARSRAKAFYPFD